MTQIDANTATWQLTQLNVDGKTLPDGPAVKLKRVVR